MDNKVFEEHEFPGRDNSIEVDMSNENKLNTDILFTQEQVDVTKKRGIDIIPHLVTQLYIDCILDIRLALDKLLYDSINEYHIVDNMKEFLEILKNKKGSAIVNIQIAMVLKDSLEMDMSTSNEIITVGNGNIYQIGIFNDIKIFVDPEKIWSDTRCIIMEKDFYNLHIDHEYEVIENEDDTSKLSLSYYLSSVSPINTLITIKSK